MVEEQAIVISTDLDQASLEIIRSKPCGLCGQTRGCGLSFWGKLFAHRANTFEANNSIQAKAGDLVVVGIEESALLFSSIAVYGIPLILLLSGALLGNVLANPTHIDITTALGAALGLLLGFVWVRVHAQGKSLQASYSPIILRLAKPESKLSVVHESQSHNS
jgi:sigma-E factor negative regulatory protein RseC